MKLRSSTKITLTVVLLLVFGGPMVYWAYATKQPGKYDELAQCLTDKDVTFFGAFWCPNCQNQKKLFENSAKRLPYVECSTQNQRGQLQVCIDAKIEAYPTWEFSDGERVVGVMTPKDLAEKAGCQLPE